MRKINLEKAERPKKASLRNVGRSDEPIALFPIDPESIASPTVTPPAPPRPRQTAAPVTTHATSNRTINGLLVALCVIAAGIILLAFIVAYRERTEPVLSASPTPPPPTPFPTSTPSSLRSPHYAEVSSALSTATPLPALAPPLASTPALVFAIAPPQSTPAAASSPAAYPPTAGFAGERFPQTFSRLLEPAEVETWTAEQIRYAINEMFARRGADFRDPQMVQWFSQFPWYERKRGATYEDTEKLFSAIEVENLKMLGRYRAARRAGVLPTQAATPATAANAADSQEPTPPKPVYSVTGISPDDTLYVRAGPGAQYPVIHRLAPGFSGFSVMGEPVPNGPDRWVRITTPSGEGWVNAKYITVTQ